MNFLLLAIGVASMLVVGSCFYTTITIYKIRQSGVYPKAGDATMADVERLKRQGLVAWAVRCYREIHGCSLREAKEKIQLLG